MSRTKLPHPIYATKEDAALGIKARLTPVQREANSRARFEQSDLFLDLNRELAKEGRKLIFQGSRLASVSVEAEPEDSI